MLRLIAACAVIASFALAPMAPAVAPAAAQALPAGADPQNTLVIDTTQGPDRDQAAQRHCAGARRPPQAARPRQVLRQRAVPPGDRRLHGPDRRRPERQRHRRLEISRPQGRVLPGAVQARHRRHGPQRRATIPPTASSSSCIADGDFLNGKYTVVGEVLSGMDVVDKIKKGEPVQNPDRMVTVRVAADVK